MSEDNEDEIAKKMMRDLGVPVAPDKPKTSSYGGYSGGYDYGSGYGSNYTEAPGGGKRWSMADWDAGNDGFGRPRKHEPYKAAKHNKGGHGWKAPKQDSMFDDDIPFGNERRNVVPMKAASEADVARAKADTKLTRLMLEAVDDIETALNEVIYTPESGAVIPNAAFDEIAGALHNLVADTLDRVGLVWGSQPSLELKAVLKMLVAQGLFVTSPTTTKLKGE